MQKYAKICVEHAICAKEPNLRHMSAVLCTVYFLMDKKICSVLLQCVYNLYPEVENYFLVGCYVFKACCFISILKSQYARNCGSHFTSRKWQHTLQKWSVQTVVTSACFPQGNTTKRVNREIVQLLLS